MKLLIFISILFCSSLALAIETLTWESCVKEASQSNLDLRVALENLRSTEYLSKGAHSGYFPQLTGNLGYSDGNTSSSTSSGSTTSLSSGSGSSSSSYSASVSVTQNLFSGLQDKAKVEQATGNEDVNKAALYIAKAKVSFDLKSAFVGLIYAQNSVKLAQDIIHRREDNLRLVQLRFESGGENKGSFLLSKAYLGQAKFDELQARQGIDVSQEQLAKVLGRDASSAIQIMGNVPIAEPSSMPDFKRIAAVTPDHQQAVAQEGVADAGIMLARSAFFPSLNLIGVLGKQGGNWFPENERWSVGLGLTFPLFNGGRDYFSTKSASALFSAASFNLNNVDKQLLVKLKQAYTTYFQAVEKLKVDEDFLRAASARAEIARKKYNNGLLTFEDWDIIENDLINREKNVLTSQRDRVINEAAWEQAQGKGVIP